MGETIETTAGSRIYRRRWQWLAGLIVLAVVATIAAFLNHSRSLARAEARAIKTALLERRFDDARRLIDAFAAKTPLGGEPDYYRAWLETVLEHPDEAMTAIRKSLSDGHPSDPLMAIRAVLQTRAGQFADAEPVLKEASRRDAEPRAEIAESLARIYLATYRFTEASRQISRWAEASPDDPRPYLWRNEIEERTDPTSPVVINNYRAALRRDPTLDKARLSLAKLLLDSHRIDEGDTEYTAYLARNPRSVPGHVGAGQIALLKGDLQGAEAHFKEALSLDPKDPIALRELGTIAMRNGDFAGACAHLKTAVEISPYDLEVRYTYAQALKTSGQDKLAAEENASIEGLRKDQKRVADLREALAKDPKNADLRSQVAQWLITQGHEKEGLEWTDLILKEKPGHRPTCKFLAEYYEKKGNAGLSNFYRSSASD